MATSRPADLTLPDPEFSLSPAHHDPTDGTDHDKNSVVQSPSLRSGNAIARFEFQKGCSTDDGTKILMVEWRDDDHTRAMKGEWTVSWDDRATVLPAHNEHAQQPDGINRLYFLLPPGERVPSVVTLVLAGPNETITWRTNALPAIFPPELGARAVEAGKRGCLHTVWAKKRLQVLAAEISAEERRNAEGVALEMALQEKEWIELNFGVVTRLLAEDTDGSGGRSASPEAATRRTAFSGAEEQQHPGASALSPEQSDIAISSFGHFAAIKGLPDASTLRAKLPQRQVNLEGGSGDDSSLDAMVKAGMSTEDDKDGLFALPLSPRSPGMAKSPFSESTTGTSQTVSRV